MENKDKELFTWPQVFREVAFKLIDSLPLILFMIVLILSVYMRYK